MSGFRSPIAIFSAILPANNSICCGTVPTILRKLVFVTCAISNSPIRICPLCIGYICCINEISVVLPEPLSPITAVVLPFSSNSMIQILFGEIHIEIPHCQKTHPLSSPASIPLFGYRHFLSPNP